MSVDGGGLHAYVAAAKVKTRAGLGVVFVDSQGRVLRRIGRCVPAPHEDLAGFQGILYALWTARRLGSRRVVVHSDNAAVVAQINGHQEVRQDLVGPYLEVRALLHAYRSARVEASQLGSTQGAPAMAEAALTFDMNDLDVTEVVVEDLPLWSWQGAAERAPA
ncbi:MAG TPA: reverse transcriptase-like protein [bacterium]|nr:reverse transcriptase-like protein [bacterium]